MFEQHLPTYIHAFESDARWKTRVSPHYIFRYFPGSEAEKDIDRIVSTQEAAYAMIMDFLRVPAPTKPIEYFFYPDASTKTALMGDDWYAQAICDEFRVHVLYTAVDKPVGPHEDTHLLSLPWGMSIGFFQEGLAEHLTGRAWDGTPHLQYVREGYKKGMYPSLAELMTHDGWMEASGNDLIYWYSLAGALVSFLIEKHGKEKFEALYKSTNRKCTKEDTLATFQKIYDFSIADAEKAFRSCIA
jgi:hypothetical protein